MAPNVVSGTASTLTGIGKDQAWLRGWFRDSPVRLGLGELRLVDETADAADTADATFLAGDEARCFSVAVRLGELEAAQAFAALHAWAGGRASHPDKSHAAVLVTETLGERYRGTLQTLAEHLPLVVIELAVWRGEQEAIVVPHVALASGTVDLSTAPATTAATVLGAMQATPSSAEAKASDPSGDSPVVDTVSDSVAEVGVDEAEERPEVIASAADAKEAADERTQGPEVVEPPLNKDDTGVTNPWRLLRRDETDPVRETTLVDAAR